MAIKNPLICQAGSAGSLFGFQAISREHIYYTYFFGLLDRLKQDFEYFDIGPTKYIDGS